MRVLLFISALMFLIVGCFNENPDVTGQQFYCNNTNQCKTGFVCQDNVCIPQSEQKKDEKDVQNNDQKNEQATDVQTFKDLSEKDVIEQVDVDQNKDNIQENTESQMQDTIEETEKQDQIQEKSEDIIASPDSAE